MAAQGAGEEVEPQGVQEARPQADEEQREVFPEEVLWEVHLVPQASVSVFLQQIALQVEVP